MSEFKLPDVGEGLTEAEIVSWKVKVGDVVAINDIIVDIETAKSVVELPSPFAGTVTALMAAEGEMVPVGTPIIAIGDADEAPAQQPAEIDLSNPAASGGGEGESLVGRNKADRGPVRRARKVASGAAAAHMQAQAAFESGAAPMVEAEELEPAVPAVAAVPETPAALRTLAKPPVRKLAKDLGVDLSTLTPTGKDGTVSREDVHAAVGTSEVSRLGAGAPRTSTTEARETREPIKGVRKMMGQAMVSSAFTIPHVTEWVSIDVTRTMEFVERLKGRREFRDVKVSPLLVLSRAVMLAMRRTPEINSVWDEPAGEVVFKSYVNLGIAAATPRGLVVPNVKDAQDLSLLELAQALNALTATAREGRTQPAEMSGGTFTITNVGPFGVDGGTPIINPGESAILCFGAIKKAPWVVDDEIAVRQVTTLALSFDHRHIDGEKGSRFLSDVAGMLEDPASALLY
ncbi:MULTISPECIES: dihydrolipoamide acetyltransferase family protein [unclassified Nocardioides]|uniref:dihydrolipoamide acetyltransferase family protein n=1 Tax=unclassified Nocardioides TaxID=2615069 RepID=UPI0009EFBAFA|nr:MULTISPECIES: dihydrolipoamide acetyltransferase family protein [unclassified Nocardioides]GAW51969.1 dehydrogenase catalytic domain-containing protein [Nocardioides sp. PD653-B2]GAW56425.1 dehydrogenase catalytic domain-containing protein [Nocardioides sp. PD653]